VGGRLECVARRLLGEAVDGGEAEKPLGVQLRRAGPRRQLPQTGAGERERQLALGDLVQGGDQPLELCAVEELDLVEQEDDPGLVLVRRLAESEEEERSSPRPMSASMPTPISRPSGGAERELLKDGGGAASARLHPLRGADREQRPLAVTRVSGPGSVRR
jgi:hypothetical protein